MHMNMHMNMCIYGSNAQAAHGVKRVAVLDFDVHHGNGCAAACWADPTRLYASSHQLGLFPAGRPGVKQRPGRAQTHDTHTAAALG